MRNTARSQVLALALFGGLAWVSLDVAELRSAAADFLFPKQIERSVPAPGFDGPALGSELAAPDLSPNPPASDLPVGSPLIVPADGTWVPQTATPLIIS